MNGPSLSQVEDGLKAALLRIKKSNGFSYDLPDDHVYTINQQQKLQSKDVEDYPKIVLTLDAGQGQKGASRSFDRVIRYGVTFILKEEFVDDLENPPAGWKPISLQLRELVQDVEKAIIEDSTLGGLVDDVAPTNFETDSDAAYPEGILVYWFDISYRRRM